MENEKLIAALRYCDAVVNDTVNTGSCNFCPYRDHCSDLDNEAADALERLTAESAEKDAEIKRLKEQVQYNHDCYFSEFAEKNRLQAELDAAVEDIEKMMRICEKGSCHFCADGDCTNSPMCTPKWRGPQ
ncbi:hypothetical protein, partial [Oscillibacter ruminantium]|uniref:hypothetical protein n=1 Tax=Oscillibacter ruminantium TaxID=1263547 RepID=UPI00058DCF91